MVATLIAALLVFVVTNLDDLVVLTVLMATARHGQGGVRAVAVGHAVGMSVVLAAATVLGVLAGHWVGDSTRWLGVVPITLGLLGLWRHWVDRGEEADASPARRVSAPAVALITISNGGDNLGVYGAVLATRPGGDVTVFLLVAVVMVGVWLGAAALFAGHRWIGATIGRWGDVLTPLVFIGIGTVVLLA